MKWRAECLVVTVPRFVRVFREQRECFVDGRTIEIEYVAKN